MGYIETQGIRFYYNKFLPPKPFVSITLFKVVFIRKSKKELEEYLQSYVGKVTVNHERIHIIQGNTLGWFKFYLLYIGYWFVNLFKKGNAYRNIPFEREAYINQFDFEYSETKWKEYIR